MPFQMTNENTVLLLTACISPGQVSFTKIVSSDIRMKQYLTAIQYYIRMTDFRVVVVENTNTVLGELDLTPEQQNRLEYITYQGNSLAETRGKGYGEMDIIQYAFQNSKFIDSSEFVVKITGRLIVNNISRLLKHIASHAKNSKSVSGVMQLNKKFTLSQFFFAPKSFYRKYFLPRSETVNDDKGVYFEHALTEAIYDWIADGGSHFNPICSIHLIGESASTGDRYSAPSIVRKIASVLRAIYVNFSLNSSLASKRKPD